MAEQWQRGRVEEDGRAGRAWEEAANSHESTTGMGTEPGGTGSCGSRRLYELWLEGSRQTWGHTLALLLGAMPGLVYQAERETSNSARAAGFVDVFSK